MDDYKAIQRQTAMIFWPIEKGGFAPSHSKAQGKQKRRITTPSQKRVRKRSRVKRRRYFRPDEKEESYLKFYPIRINADG